MIIVAAVFFLSSYAGKYTWLGAAHQTLKKAQRLGSAVLTLVFAVGSYVAFFSVYVSLFAPD
ncbi:MAG: hypothetical protein AAGE85_12460 [Pseudomonadota bacterium]